MEYKEKICLVGLIDSYWTPCNKLGHNSHNDYNAKFEKVLPTHDVAIQIPQVPIKYDSYRKRLTKHLDCKTLKEMGVSPKDFSTHSFRLGGLSMLADGEINPAFIQNSAPHKHWESSVTYIKPSLSKAL